MTEKVLSVEDLPMTFQAKYLGSCKAAGLWGIKHTRKPVDQLVETAKATRQNLRFVEVTVSTDGLHVQDPITRNLNSSPTYAIDSISYGVQDLTFTRVFCMIVCNSQALEDTARARGPPPPPPVQQMVDHVHEHTQAQRVPEENLFMCHAFACESKHHARQLTFALAAAFKHFADVMKSKPEKGALSRTIDLRTAEQIADEGSETEA